MTRARDSEGQAAVTSWPRGHDLIAIGASAGGVEALIGLVDKLDVTLPAAVLVVLHRAAGGQGRLAAVLQQRGGFPVSDAGDGVAIEPGHLYLAPPGMHLVVEPGRLRIVDGPRINGHRPAIDALFRSVAECYGPRAIGVVLTGALDCGTFGLMAIRRSGGLTVVQDPADAAEPSMPASAIANVEVDHVVKLAELPSLLRALVASPPGRRGGELPSAPSRLTQLRCPDCGGPISEQQIEELARFGCRLGHDFGIGLAARQEEAVELALWAAVNALEDREEVARRLGEGAARHGHPRSAAQFLERARESEASVVVLRQLLSSLAGRVFPQEEAAGAEAAAGEGERSPAPG